MEKTIKCHGLEFAILETEDGYSINVKGDKEKLKAKVEYIEAYFNYKEKAKAAGICTHPHGHHHRHHHHRSSEGSGFRSLLHAHMRAMQDHTVSKSTQE